MTPSWSAGYHWFVSPAMNPKKCWNPLPVGHRSNGPAGLVSHTGTSWHLPNCAVAYPFNRKISASGVTVFGRTEL